MQNGWMQAGLARRWLGALATGTMVLAGPGCSSNSDSAGATATKAANAPQGMSQDAMASADVSSSASEDSGKAWKADTGMADVGPGNWGGGSDAASSDAAGGVASADDQKRAWRKQVETAPLASVSVGGDKKLDLVAMRITVQVEGLRARTLVDHIFHNPHPKVTEGKFRYSLPADATVSYYAMFGGGAPVAQPEFFGKGDKLQGQDAAAIASAAPEQVSNAADPSVWSDLKEARVVAQEVATQVYEIETSQKIDPALVEELAPNTFEAKVFPIPANGYNRVLVAFEQTLPRIAGAYEYTFIVPKSEMGSVEFTLIAGKSGFSSANSSGGLATQAKETKNYWMHHWLQTNAADQASAGGVLAVDLTPTADTADADVLTGTDPVTKKVFTLMRLHPAMAGLQAKQAAKEAVFVLDTSASEGPGRFKVDIELMTAILEKSSKIEKFQVITFDAGARWLAADWLPNTVQGRKQALDLLDGVLLEGATHFSTALRTLAKPPMAITEPLVDVMVLSDGVINLGENSAETLIGRFLGEAPFAARFFAYRLGIGGDNVALFQALTRKGGAVFNCLTGADLPACAVAHEAPGMTVDSVTIEGAGADGAQVTDLLVAGRQATLFPGATLTVAARVLKPGAAIVHIKGVAPGLGAQDIAVPVMLQSSGELAPRGWAEIAVAQLLETHEAKFEGLALALSQHFGIASRLGSFLVLESEATWQKYDLNQESQKLGDTALGKLLDIALKAQASVWTSWQQLVSQLKAGNSKSHVMEVDGGKLLDTVTTAVPAAELELPESQLLVPLVKAADVPEAYLLKLKAKAAFVVDPYSDEAERRRKEGQIGAAVRALTTALEFNPSDAEIERLVGWRVRSWQQPELAGVLFLDVLRKRPFEPQSYRDLATTLGSLRPGPTMLLYEAVLAGDWNPKFKAVKTVVMEEYALFMQALQAADPKHPLLSYLAQRKQTLNLQTPTGDLRVTITWNTDNVDIDLWVTDPAGEKCFYSHKDTASGGHLLDDLTQGFGPERFVSQKAMAGEYLLQAHYYSNNGNAVEATTYVTATVMTKAGTPAQTVQTYDFVLHKKDQVASFAKVAFK